MIACLESQSYNHIRYIYVCVCMRVSVRTKRLCQSVPHHGRMKGGGGGEVTQGSLGDCGFKPRCITQGSCKRRGTIQFYFLIFMSHTVICCCCCCCCCSCCFPVQCKNVHKLKRKRWLNRSQSSFVEINMVNGLYINMLYVCICVVLEAEIAQWLEHQKVAGSTTGECYSPGSTFCADSYFGIRSTPVLPQQHVQEPGLSAKSVEGTQVTVKYVCTLRMWLF